MLLKENFQGNVRKMKLENLSCDFTVVGGGLAGTCAAVSAAREGAKVVLIQDRPVLGGNASSEVRLWALGATSHQGNNNRYAREGGLIDEIMVENLRRNPEGNPVLFDMVLIDKVRAEKNITLLLNTVMTGVCKSDADTVSSVEAFNSQNQTVYRISSKLFCDASGDGVLAFMAGASYRMGAEDSAEFGEKYAPDDEYGQMLGHSIFFYSKNAGKPVEFKAPDIALKDITEIPRYTLIDSSDQGCRFWWLEYGATLDTIYDNETIKFELWKIVYGVWDYIKNSGKFQDVENLTLEWVGLIPGKRESRRFNGLYMLNQNDIVSQRRFDDAVAFGGWAIDLHPAEGVYSSEPPCTQYHSKGIYSIPYRCLVSRDLKNLFIAGRIMSVSHVAFGSTRVMMTLGHCSQAVGAAAALCVRHGVLPADILDGKYMTELQDILALNGQSIPFYPIRPEINKASAVHVSATTSLALGCLPFDGGWRELEFSTAQMLPLKAGLQYSFIFEIRSDRDADVEVSLRKSSRLGNYTPDETVDTVLLHVKRGADRYEVKFDKVLDAAQYAFIAFSQADGVCLRESRARVTGIMTVYNRYNKAVAKSAEQKAPENSGIDSFEFWIPERRPGGANIAMEIAPSLDVFDCTDVLNGYVRPFVRPNAWVAEFDDRKPVLTLEWNEPETLHELILYFDTDYDHSMECVQMGHPENVIPFCVNRYRVTDREGRLLHEAAENYRTINRICFPGPLTTKVLRIEFEKGHEDIPVSLFQIVVR